MTVWMVWDYLKDQPAGIYSTKAGARMAAMNLALDEHRFTREELEEIANDNGYTDIEEFIKAINDWFDYDSDIEVKVEEVEVQD